MSWVLRLSMAASADFDIIGPGMAYFRDSGCVYVDVPVALDAHRKANGRPPAPGSVPYGASEWMSVLLGCMDGLRDMRRPVLSFAVQLERYDSPRRKTGG